METQTHLQAAAERCAHRVITRLAELRETLDYQAGLLGRDGIPVDVGQILRQTAAIAEASAEHARVLAEIRCLTEIARYAA